MARAWGPRGPFARRGEAAIGGVDGSRRGAAQPYSVFVVVILLVGGVPVAVVKVVAVVVLMSVPLWVVRGQLGRDRFAGVDEGIGDDMGDVGVGQLVAGLLAVAFRHHEAGVTQRAQML